LIPASTQSARGGITLGDIYVDLYTDGGISWNGKPGEFSEEQLNAIFDHIVFRNIPELEHLTDDWNQQGSGDYRLYNDIPTEDTALLVVKNGDKRMMVSVNRRVQTTPSRSIVNRLQPSSGKMKAGIANRASLMICSTLLLTTWMTRAVFN